MTEGIQLFGRTIAIVRNICRLKSTAKKTVTLGTRSAKESSRNPSRGVAKGTDPLLGLGAAEGAGNPRNSAAALQKLAKLEHAQKRYVEAESLYRRALAIRQQVLGPRHPKVASILYNLGRLYSDQGRYSEAEPLFLQSLAIVQEFLGPEHPKVIKRFSRLAKFYEGRGRYSEAAKFRDQLPRDSGFSVKTDLAGDEI